jgi:peptidoglycan/LPS O-acetylase OafA/YrhL
LIVAYATALQGKHRPGAFMRMAGCLEHPAMKWLGAFSYSLYATHCAVLLMVNSLLVSLAFSPTFTLLARGFVGIPFAVVVGYIVSLCFEAPYLKRRESRILLRSPGA